MSVKVNELYLNCKFERLNSKHNRMWEQLTTICTFTGTIITAFVGSLYGFDRIRFAGIVDYAYIIMAILVGILASMIGRLMSEIRKNRIGLECSLSEMKD